ncbi:hypothetical protein EC843_10716 [Buttiauxella sp. JUb87]|nr:hypothetical protein EC843_10716 [Buttiauxella sp. JUb87]
MIYPASIRWPFFSLEVPRVIECNPLKARLSAIV